MRSRGGSPRPCDCESTAGFFQEPWRRLGTLWTSLLIINHGQKAKHNSWYCHVVILAGHHSPNLMGETTSVESMFTIMKHPSSSSLGSAVLFIFLAVLWFGFLLCIICKICMFGNSVLSTPCFEMLRETKVEATYLVTRRTVSVQDGLVRAAWLHLTSNGSVAEELSIVNYSFKLKIYWMLER